MGGVAFPGFRPSMPAFGVLRRTAPGASIRRPSGAASLISSRGRAYRRSSAFIGGSAAGAVAAADFTQRKPT